MRSLPLVFDQLHGSLTSPAMAACRYGDSAALGRLLQRGCPVDAADYDGRTLLHVAVTNKQQVGSQPAFIIVCRVCFSVYVRMFGGGYQQAVGAPAGSAQIYACKRDGARPAWVLSLLNPA
jgi:hypothetical protein